LKYIKKINNIISELKKKNELIKKKCYTNKYDTLDNCKDSK